MTEPNEPITWEIGAGIPWGEINDQLEPFGVEIDDVTDGSGDCYEIEIRPIRRAKPCN